ncbi:hypothetical protein HYFRA_00008390 [Hymenoscyphus fraxineus]|uniref:Uncharacterized protein n=1 Tax=Hymenoscyphus fraxineus TaxID=746836 RepID=A0A9N9KMR5_9HELO|nr:hypothetical protein HYFRA_00008390 [Hymenoscyphus fraxineus]
MKPNNNDIDHPNKMAFLTKLLSTRQVPKAEIVLQPTCLFDNTGVIYMKLLCILNVFLVLLVLMGVIYVHVTTSKRFREYEERKERMRAGRASDGDFPVFLLEDKMLKPAGEKVDINGGKIWTTTGEKKDIKA